MLKNKVIKFEIFYFDVFKFSDNVALLECLRNEEFAPIKNTNKEKDSP